MKINNSSYISKSLAFFKLSNEEGLKNADGTPDKSAHPKNNIYQDNVLTLAKNSLEYLKTR